MPFLFTHAFLLSALAGLGIPVLLHLLLKQRNPRMRVSTLRFFEVRDTRSSSRRKLRNWLLLLLRLLVFALIVLAFARPYLPDGWRGKTQPKRRDVVIIIDPSLSIRSIDSGKPRWPAVLDEARQILAGLADNDRAALIGMGGKAEVLSGFAPSAVIRNTLDALKPGSTSGDLGEASTDTGHESHAVCTVDASLIGGDDVDVIVGKEGDLPHGLNHGINGGKQRDGVLG
jgi:hypothetical protein